MCIQRLSLSFFFHSSVSDVYRWIYSPLQMYMRHIDVYIYSLLRQMCIQPTAFGVSLHLNLQSQSPWSLFNETWQKRPREREHRWRFEIEEITAQMQWAVSLLARHRSDVRNGIWYCRSLSAKEPWITGLFCRKWGMYTSQMYIYHSSLATDQMSAMVFDIAGFFPQKSHYL